MKQITSTLNIFLRQEWISVTVYFIATVLFLFIIYQTGVDLATEEIEHHQRHSLLLITMLSIFIGLYLGNGFLRLQKSPLWLIHPGYRLNLILSLICAAFIYGAVQFTAMFYAGWGWPISLLAPGCITLLSAQFIIGNNLLLKYIFPATPFILFQLTNYEINYNLILLLLIIVTSLAIYLNASNKQKLESWASGLMSGNLQQQLKAANILSWNNKFADLYQKIHAPVGKSDLSIALIQPANRFGLSSLLIGIFCLVSLYFIDSDSGKLEIETFATMILGSGLMGGFIELKLLARQTKPVAHLFGQSQHAIFKKKILTCIDKHISIQAALFIIFILLISLLVDGFVKPLLMLKMGFSIAIIGLAFLPMMLCLNWFNINFKLILVMLIYAAIAFWFCGWIYQHSLMDLLSLPALLAITGLVLIRLVSSYLWKRQSVEQFMRVYG